MHVLQSEPVHYSPTGYRGRPRKVPDLELLREAFRPTRGITLACLAATIGMHPNTLSHYMKKFQVTKHFSNLPDHEIDRMIKNYRSSHPHSGIRYVIGHLRQAGYRLQRRRIIASLRRVDQVGPALRKAQHIRRRTYRVARPNALWHGDGHHKLIRWGIVLHGFIDGYSRLVSLC